MSRQNKEAELQSAEALLAELHALDEKIKKKVSISGAAMEERYETDIAPKVIAIEKLVTQRSPVARNAAEDALLRFREFFITGA